MTRFNSRAHQHSGAEEKNSNKIEPKDKQVQIDRRTKLIRNLIACQSRKRDNRLRKYARKRKALTCFSRPATTSERDGGAGRESCGF
jgi:hypothetical protein